MTIFDPNGIQEEYQIQIVLVKHIYTERTDSHDFVEISRTDPVYEANVDTSGHVEAVVSSIERYAKNL